MERNKTMIKIRKICGCSTRRTLLISSRVVYSEDMMDDGSSVSQISSPSYVRIKNHEGLAYLSFEWR